MERVKGRMTIPLARFVDRLLWEMGRSARAFLLRFGWLGGLLLGCMVLSLGAWFFGRVQARELATLQTRITRQKAIVAQPVAVHPNDQHARLKLFEDLLLVHEDIPFALQDVLSLAEKEGLKMQRGEYRLQADAQGGFMRYRMTTSVKGAPQAVFSFMQSALRGQKALAMESVQFKRERAESTEIEARIQWTFLTKPPGGRSWSIVSSDDAGKGQR